MIYDREENLTNRMVKIYDRPNRSAVARVSSARGPMLGAAPPPPPRLVNPASAPGEKVDKQKKRKKGLQHEKVETQGDRGP